MPTTPDAGTPSPGSDATVQMPAASAGDQGWGGSAVPPPPGAPGGGAPIPPPPGAPGSAGSGFGGQPPYVPGGPIGGGPGDGGKKSNTPLIVGAVAAVLVLALVIAGIVLLGNKDDDVAVGTTGTDTTPATSAETTTTEKAGTSSTRRTTTTRGTTTTTKPKGPADGVPASGTGWEMDTGPTWEKTTAPGSVDAMWTLGPRDQSLGDSVAIQVLPQGGMSPKEMTDIMAKGLGEQTGGKATVSNSGVEKKNGREYGVIDVSMASDAGTTINQRVYLFIGKSKSLMVMAQGLPSRQPAVVTATEPYILTANLTS